MENTQLCFFNLVHFIIVSRENELLCFQFSMKYVVRISSFVPKGTWVL